MPLSNQTAVAAVAGVVGQEAHAHRKFGWERLGLALVPAAWILLQVRATATLGKASPTVVSPSLAVARAPVTHHRPTLCLPQAVPMVYALDARSEIAEAVKPGLSGVAE